MASKMFRELLAQVPADIRNFNTLTMGLAAYIDDILKYRRLSRKDLAKKLGKSESEISKWMNGDHNFTLSTISKIEAALDTQLVTIPVYREDQKPLEQNSNASLQITNKSIPCTDGILPLDKLQISMCNSSKGCFPTSDTYSINLSEEPSYA